MQCFSAKPSPQGAPSPNPSPQEVASWQECRANNLRSAERRLADKPQLRSLAVEPTWLERTSHLLEQDPSTFEPSDPDAFRELVDTQTTEMKRALSMMDGSQDECWLYSYADDVLLPFSHKLRPPLDAASLQLADLHDANLAGASLKGAFLQGADLSGADLRFADLRDAKLSLANLGAANLTGALISGADFRGANLSATHMHGTWAREACFDWAQVENSAWEEVFLVNASMQGCIWDCCSLQGSWLDGAKLQDAKLSNCILKRARLAGADLTDAELRSCTFAGGELAGATWGVSSPPRVAQITVEGSRFAAPRRREVRAQGGNLRRLLMMLFFDDSDGEEDADSEDQEEEENKEEEEEEDKEEEDPNEKAQLREQEEQGEEGSFMPLLSEAVEVAGDLAGQAADQAESFASRQLQSKVEKAKARLGEMMVGVDATVKPKARALQKMMASRRFVKLCTSPSVPPTTVNKVLGMIARTKSAKKLNKTLDEVCTELQKIQDQGMAPLLQKVLDAQLAGRTGYSSGQILRIFRITALQMARDARELNKLQAYLEKMQETVNENNWDDVLDNFTCFFALQKHLQGERSQQIFQMVWKDQAFRACVQQAVLFEEVLPVNHPPVFVIHTVKKAVGYIKDNAESWEKAIAKELAAIELTRTRQSQFFAFLVSAVTGVFMYIATFLSSVTFQAFQEGRLTLPYLSEWLHD